MATRRASMILPVWCSFILLCQCSSSDPTTATSAPGDKNGLRLSVANQFVSAKIALAVGANCDVAAAAPADMLDAIATVTAATSSAKTTLIVVEASGHRAKVQGLAPGSATLTVAATLGYGELLKATADFVVRPAAKLTLQPGCGGSGAPLFVTQRQVWIPAQLAAADGAKLLGYGFHPVAIDPPVRLNCDTTSTSLDHWLCQTGDQPGPVTLASQLDAQKWQVTLASEGQIDGVSVEPATGTPVHAGEIRTVRLRPTVGGEPLCGAVPEFTIAAATPAICAVGPASNKPSEAGLDPGLFVEFKGYSAGACQVTVSIPSANGGAGLTQIVNLGAVQAGK